MGSYEQEQKSSGGKRKPAISPEMSGLLAASLTAGATGKAADKLRIGSFRTNAAITAISGLAGLEAARLKKKMDNQKKMKTKRASIRLARGFERAFASTMDPDIEHAFLEELGKIKGANALTTTINAGLNAAKAKLLTSAPALSEAAQTLGNAAMHGPGNVMTAASSMATSAGINQAARGANTAGSALMRKSLTLRPHTTTYYPHPTIPGKTYPVRLDTGNAAAGQALWKTGTMMNQAGNVLRKFEPTLSSVNDLGQAATSAFAR